MYDIMLLSHYDDRGSTMAEQRPRKKLHHDNTPDHAHELTFSCYRRQTFFNDSAACQMFLDELNKSRGIYDFKLWAYVLMPHHVHLLIWPLDHNYDIGKIESGMKGVMAKRYRKHLWKTDRLKHDSFMVTVQGQAQFVFWQKWGELDRNLWNAKANHDSIVYIEANPVRSRFAAFPEEWPWSSAYTRSHKEGVIPDTFAMPFAVPNLRYQRVGVV
jgi:putative transposase